MKDRARAVADDAFERGVGDLFEATVMASPDDRDAPIRFANGITILTEARTRAMAVIDSFPSE